MFSTTDIDELNEPLGYFFKLFIQTINGQAPIELKPVKHTNQPDLYTQQIQTATKHRDYFKFSGNEAQYKQCRQNV